MVRGGRGIGVATSGLVKRYHSGHGKRAAEVVALDGLDLEARDHELLAVVGPSGSGKTTLLRCIAGFERPDDGRIDVDGRDVTDEPPADRDVAMVFQEYALYPHLTAARNITYGLRARKVPSGEIERRLADVSAMLEIDDVLDRRPNELSGGERQRVALGRALVREPRAFLMDEPLSSLDAELRARARAEIKSLQRQVATTTIYVTHDQIEAMTVGDRVAVLRAGRLEQVDEPLALYERPVNTFVARFIGSPPMNLLPATVMPPSMRRGGVAGIRPERVELVAVQEGMIEGTTTLVEIVGPEAIVHIDVDGNEILVKSRPDEVPAPSARVGLRFDERAVHYFESLDGPALT